MSISCEFWKKADRSKLQLFFFLHDKTRGKKKNWKEKDGRGKNLQKRRKFVTIVASFTTFLTVLNLRWKFLGLFILLVWYSRCFVIYISIFHDHFLFFFVNVKITWLHMFWLVIENKTTERGMGERVSGVLAWPHDGTMDGR